MKIFYLIISLLIVDVTLAQDELVFNKKYTQSEDKWVAFQADSIGSHNFGFIYIDAMAGLTFDYAGSFVVKEDGKFELKKKEVDRSMKYRLEPNSVLIAIIPESHYAELEVSKFPEWLKYYKEDEDSIERLYKWGYMYNAWGECTKALEYLEKAEKKNPDFEGLRVELGFSYNCSKQFKKAIEILKIAVKEEPKNAYINKELLYAQIHNNQIDEAIITYNRTLEEVSDTSFNAENAFNILGEYYRQKNLKKFTEWKDKTKIDKDKRFGQYVEMMRKELSENK